MYMTDRDQPFYIGMLVAGDLVDRTTVKKSDIVLFIRVSILEFID